MMTLVMRIMCMARRLCSTSAHLRMGGPEGSQPHVGICRGVPPAHSAAPKIIYLPEMIDLSMRIPASVIPYVTVPQAAESVSTVTL